MIIWIEREVYLKLDVQGQGSGRILKVDGVRVLENWAIFLDVICVSFVMVFSVLLDLLS